ncbi:hypothetical protein AQPE_0454 [Aquipluma nitroreducens]|uniref:Uncharacterized protein n=1 Tax=Aquipluma nitroreducens TaxID=2010828 RepID=A0A5K7S491_9BACT|nr:hypothetical protein [Aquipluma nitroreducens]BBE16317.1 hypothetical protein AQPE_0454 [Aquipluma nitroreducens]
MDQFESRIIFEKKKKKQSKKKKKKANQEPVGAEMQGCPAFFSNTLIKVKTKMIKKAGHLLWSCICSDVGLCGDWLN